MRIDESCINHNALRLISETVSELYEFTEDTTSDDNMRIATMGEIRGICQLADTLKEALKS